MSELFPIFLTVRKIIFAVLLFFLFATPVNAQVVISEVYPAPTSDENEWVELYNSSEELIDISNWKLYEHFSSKNELVTFNNITINPKSFYVYELTSSKLNNSEEKVSLENDMGEEISSQYYKDSQSQKSFSYLFIDEESVGKTLEISEPTKGQKNQIEITTTPTPIPNPSSTPNPTVEPVSPETKITDNGNLENNHKQENSSFPQSTKEPINYALLKHKELNSKLKLPNIAIQEKKDLRKRLPQFSYIVQKKVSKSGVINAIIGGSLIILAGLII